MSTELRMVMRTNGKYAVADTNPNGQKEYTKPLKELKSKVKIAHI